MMIKDLIESAGKEKRKQERVKVIRKVVVGMSVVAVAGVATGILLAPKSGKETREDLKIKAVKTIQNIKSTVREKAEAVKDSVTHAEQEIGNVIKDVHEKTEVVKKDIKDGSHEIKQDIHKAAENISREHKK